MKFLDTNSDARKKYCIIILKVSVRGVFVVKVITTHIFSFLRKRGVVKSFYDLKL
jgi:hypothetical protein